MQRSQALDTLDQPTLSRPAASLIDDFHVVIGLGSVIPDEQQRVPLSANLHIEHGGDRR